MTSQDPEVVVSPAFYFGVLISLLALQAVASILSSVWAVMVAEVAIVYWISPYLVSGMSWRSHRTRHAS